MWCEDSIECKCYVNRKHIDICTYTQLSTKNLIAQDITTYEGLYKTTQLLDQLCDGLKKAGVLHIIRAFPNEFLSTFVYTKITAEDVLSIMNVPWEQDGMLMTYFNQFIHESDETGNQYIIIIMIASNHNEAYS